MKSFGMMLVLALSFGVFLSLPSSAFAKGGNHLMKACKKECPEAKDEKAVLECIASKENDEAFKKTKCYSVHEKHHHGGEHHEEGAAEPAAK